MSWGKGSNQKEEKEGKKEFKVCSSRGGEKRSENCESRLFFGCFLEHPRGGSGSFRSAVCSTQECFCVFYSCSLLSSSSSSTLEWARRWWRCELNSCTASAGNRRWITPFLPTHNTTHLSIFLTFKREKMLSSRVEFSNEICVKTTESACSSHLSSRERMKSFEDPSQFSETMERIFMSLFSLRFSPAALHFRVSHTISSLFSLSDEYSSSREKCDTLARSSERVVEEKNSKLSDLPTSNGNK